MGTLEIYREMLEEKKTTASKKAFLTRCKKEVEGMYNEMKELQGKFFLGNKVTKFSIWKLEIELKVINKLKNELDESKI